MRSIKLTDEQIDAIFDSIIEWIKDYNESNGLCDSAKARILWPIWIDWEILKVSKTKR